MQNQLFAFTFLFLQHRKYRQHYRSSMHASNSDHSFLFKCKSLVQQQLLQELIIPDSKVFPPPLYSHRQILVSQYAIAKLQDSVNSFVLKKNKNFPIPIVFAAYEKLVEREDFSNAILMLENLRSTSNYNKHVFLFNMGILYKQQKNYNKAIFYLQTLLKEHGGNLQYVYYEYAKLLIKENRSSEAERLVRNYLEKQTQSRPYLESLYLSMIQKKTKKQIINELHSIFHNRTLSPLSTFNLALLLRKIDLQKSLQLFLKVQEKVDDKLKSKVKICILNLKKQIWEQKNQSEVELSSLYLFEQQEFLENQLLGYMQLSENKLEEKDQLEIAQKIEEVQRIKRVVGEKMKIQRRKLTPKFQSKKELEPNILQGEENKEINKGGTKYDSFILKLKSQSEKKEKVKKEEQYKTPRISKSTANPKGVDQAKKKKKEHLKFLLSKQKQLNTFFKRIRIYKKNNIYDVKLIEKSVLGGRNKEKSKGKFDQQISKEFSEKMKQFQLINQNNTQDLINKFFNQYVSFNYPEIQKNNTEVSKGKDTQTERKFILNRTSMKKHVQTNRTHKTSENKIRSQQEVNKKQNLFSSKKIFESIKMENKIPSIKYLTLNQQINNMNSSSKKSPSQTLSRAKFDELLRVGKELQDSGSIEQAYNHFIQMYKKNKKQEQKQIIMLKIAHNFELQQMDEEAQKTYLKCTKFNLAEAFYRLGNLQIKNGKVSLGVENLEKANCLDRQNIEIQMKLVYGYSLLDQTASRALSLAHTILKRNPQSLQTLIMTAKVLEKQGRAKQALQIALTISRMKNSPTLDHYVGLLYLQQSNVNEAFKYFQKALKYKPDHIPSLIEVATILSDIHPDEAINILKKALELDPQNQLACTRLGKIYETSDRNYENAIITYKRSLQIDPNYESYLKIGDCLFEQEMYGQAAFNYKQALNIKKTAQIFQKLANVYEKQGNLKKATDSYSSAIELISEESDLFSKKKYFFQMGRISLTLQEYDTAQNYLLDVLQIQQSYEVLKMLGQTFYGKGEYSQALQYYRQAAALLPSDNLQLLESIGSCFDKMEEYLASKQIYEKILIEDPKNVSCLNNLANILLIIGNTNEAFYYFEQMLSEVPQNIERRLRVVDIYATIGDWSKVEEHLLICYKQKETDIRVIERLLNLYKQKRQSKQIAKFEKRLNFLKQNKRN